MGLLMVMLLSLLVYSIAERRLRAALKEQEQTLPNQIGVPVNAPTMRWVFQLFEGIHLLKLTLAGQVDYVIDGINALRDKILRLLGQAVMKIYSISSA